MSGHGHVIPNDDGSVARCGGPSICPVCAQEFASMRQLADAVGRPVVIAPRVGECRRPSKDVYFLSMARLVATRSTCARRSVGCVLVDVRGRVLATGYNGVAAGQPHCNEGHPCVGAAAASGTQLDACQAIHAEQNALLQCRDPDAIATCYVTVSPCVSCLKLLLGTGCTRIVFAEAYVNADEVGKLWTSSIARSPAMLDQLVTVPRTWLLCDA